MSEDKEQQIALANGGNTNGGGTNAGDPNAKWYFYNTQSLGFGKGEFKRVWGNRPLEDNWRISDKSIISSDVVAKEAGENQKIARYELSTYLETVPITSKEIDSLVYDRNTALFELGLIYKEQFKNKDTYDKN